MAMHYHPLPTESKKSVGQQAVDSIVYVAICLTVYYLLSLIAKVFIAPFKFLFMSDKAKLEEKINRAKAKTRARENFRLMISDSDANPMNQYLQRFKFSVAEFAGDSDNDFYLEWYEAFKKGLVLDTDLCWAPDIYVVCNGVRTLNKDFLDYFSAQFDLHMNSTLKSKIQFMQTIRRFYPEFTPRFSAIPSELQDLYERVRAKDLHNELIGVLVKKGVSTGVARLLVNSNLAAEEIKKAIPLVKRCQEASFCDEACMFAVRHGYDPADYNEDVDFAINAVIECANNEAMALALLNGDVKPQELGKLVKEAARESTPETVRSNVNRRFQQVMKSKALNAR